MLLFIGYYLYHAMKAAISDTDMRSRAQSRGWDTYSSQTGVRDVKTNKRCYKDANGNKTMW